MSEKDRILIDRILTDLESIDMPGVDVRRQARRLRTLIFGETK